MATLVVNELLCFLSVQYDKMDRENLVTSLLEFYSYREAIDAKNLLVSECEKVSIVDSIKEFSVKRVDGKSGALCRVITDAVDIWSVIDHEKAGEIGVKFVAANPNCILGVNAEKFSLQFLISEIKKLHKTVDNQSIELTELKSLVQNNNSNNNNNNNNNNKNVNNNDKRGRNRSRKPAKKY